MAVPPRHLNDITAVRPAMVIARHYRLDPPPRSAAPALPWALDLLTELVRSAVYAAGALLGLAIALTLIEYVPHWW